MKQNPLLVFLTYPPLPPSKSKELPNTSEELVNKRTNRVIWGSRSKGRRKNKKEKQNKKLAVSVAEFKCLLVE